MSSEPNALATGLALVLQGWGIATVSPAWVRLARLVCRMDHRWGEWRIIPGDADAIERHCARCGCCQLVIDGYMHESYPPLTSGRWKAQGFLTPDVTGADEHPYGAAFFATRRAADQFADRLYRDHGAGMVRVEVTRA